jgi:hypothetical protein
MGGSLEGIDLSFVGSVPEPSTAMLLCLVAAARLVYVRQKRY